MCTYPFSVTPQIQRQIFLSNLIYRGTTMILYRFCIKSGQLGSALTHSKYIGRNLYKSDEEKRSDLQLNLYKNLPASAGGDPEKFWKAADRHERKNGSVYREWEIALPACLPPEIRQEIVIEFCNEHLKNKTHQIAIHNSIGARSGEAQPHAHVMFSDRVQDQYSRPLEQHFSRYNSKHPESGGCKKDSGGKHPLELAREVRQLRSAWEGTLNSALERHGISDRVDSRCLRDQGITREPDRYLGPARVRQLKRSQLGNGQ